jgi:spore coat protein A
MPGERHEAIIDFSGFAGATLEMQNTAPCPYPFGDPVDPETTGKIMRFEVASTAKSPGVVYDPSTGASPRSAPMVSLSGPAATPALTRLLTLNEIEAEGGPEEVMINNTMYNGKHVDTLGSVLPRPDFQEVDLHGIAIFYSEVPQEGTTEVWEIANTTADAHPIHLHLVQFQILSRQVFDNEECYDSIYQETFPLGELQNEYGPPLDYNIPNDAGAIGGNPDVTPCLVGYPRPPAPDEAGWKDTVQVFPGEVTRLAVRWAPTSLAANTPAGQLYYPFDPDHGRGYVWHCHILDHEDNEMMRPTMVTSNPAVAASSRSYVKGVDY